MSDLAKPLYDRLVGAKFIFRRGVELLEKGGPFSAGMAVLAFQDAAEMILRVIAEHLHAKIKPITAFNQIMDEIDNQGSATLSHRSSLNQLNKARVNFKHSILEPRVEDVRKFRSDLESFFASSLPQYLGVDFHTLSLTDLVRHTRTANWLRDGERHMEANEYQEAIRCSAVAFSLARNRFELENEPMELERIVQPRVGGSSDIPRKVVDLARKVEQGFKLAQEQFDILTDGMSLADYRRFKSQTPSIMIARDGGIHPCGSAQAEVEGDYEQALFCMTFVIDSVLRMQQRDGTGRFRQEFPETEYVIVRPTPVLVCSGQERQEEEICEVEAGEVLQAYYQAYDKEGYVAILFDNELAYVTSDSIKEKK